MKQTILAISLAVTILTLVSCVQTSHIKQTTMVETQVLAAYGWKLIQFNGIVISEFNPSLQLNATNGEIYGSTGCNQYFGTFTRELNKITLNMTGMTKMAGPIAAMQTEQSFSELMQGKTYIFDLTEQGLNLLENGKTMLMFERTEKK